MGKYISEEQQQFVERFRRLESRGVPIYIDGRHLEEEDWYRVSQVQEDGAFYMCDYIGIGEGPLKEIHFDRVYNR